MGLSRRFQNLITVNRRDGSKSLRSVDLMRQLFVNTAKPSTTRGESAIAVGQDSAFQTPAADIDIQKNGKTAVAGLNMGKIRLPSPIFTFQARTSSLNNSCRIDCFPLVGRTMMWADYLGRPFFFDAEMHQMDIMPNLHNSKWMPFSLFVPNAQVDADGDLHHYGSSLFIMERLPKPEANCITQLSDQFEAFVYRKPDTWAPGFKSWLPQLLPPPPYVRDLKYWHSCSRPEIRSYAIVSVGADSYICISVNGVGTYCLDTASHTWSKVGEWTLPFHGRVEHVPELKLWFGFTEDQHLAAADLSSMESQPQLVGSWKELYFPEEWKECKDSQLVNLGYGRFCIARFLNARTLNGNPGFDQNVAVFTGVEVVPHVQDASCGNVELKMIPYKSLGHVSKDTAIDAVF